MRQKLLPKILKKPFWKFYKRKSIQVFDIGGWHFNSLLKPEDISLKLKSFAHMEFKSDEYSNIDVITKISMKKEIYSKEIEFTKK